MPHVAFARLLYSAYVDRKQYVEFFSQIQSLANNNPQEACAQLAAFGVEFVFTGRLIKNTNQLSKHAKEFARLLREEARIVHAAAAGGIDVPIQTPLLKAVGNAAAEVKQNGSAGKGYSSLCEEVYATHRELPPTDKKFWKHIFKWEENKKTLEPKGFHFEKSYEGKLIEKLTLPPDEFGIYAGYYEHGDWWKFSTFFPKNLNRIQIKEKIEQAFKKPIEKGNFCVIGTTNENLKIKIVFARSHDGSTRIVSAFPLYKGDPDIMKHAQSLGLNKLQIKKR